MNMGSNKFTPKEIAKGDKTFSIPLYQRLFSWKEENVKKLLYDMKEHFKDKDKPYYLGMLTCVKQGEKELLIDGQQRMTVMLLMAIVFKKVHDEWKNFLLNGNRIDFIARPEDKEYIKSKIEEANTQKVQYENLNMKEALRTIESFLENEFKDDNERKTFVKYVYEHLTFFISSLPKNYKSDANLLNKYFEAMNSQGRGLEQHEILKVDLLKNMHKVDDQKDNDQITLTRIWNVASQMDRPIIKQKEAQDVIEYGNNYEAAIDAIKANDFSRCFKIIETIDDEEGNEGNIETIEAAEHKFSNIFREDGSYSPIKWEELLLLALDITNEEQKREGMSDFAFYNTDKLLERFEGLKSNPVKIKEFYRNLLFCRLLMDYCVIRREIRSGEGDYSLLIKVDNEKSDEDGNADNSESIKLRQFQSMLYVSTPFYEWLKPFLIFLKEELEDNRGLPNVEQMLKELKRKDNEGHTLNEGNLSYHNINRYWFWRLDYYLWETRDDWCKCEDGQAKKKEEYKKYYAAVSKYVFRENRSIEHFHPQDESHNTSWKPDVVDSFGNLAMISPSFNSQQSNDHMQIKFDRIHEQLEAKSLQSLKLLRMCLKANFDHSQWTEEKAKKHGEEMKELLRDSFLQKVNNSNAGTE